MTQEIIKIIKKEFPELYEKELQMEIVEHGKLVNKAQGEVIMDTGSYIKVMPLLINGVIKVVREDGEGHEILMYYIKPGETCAMSLTCCFQDLKSEIKAIAEEDCTLIMIPVKFMDIWMKEFSSWKNYVMQTYRSRFEELLHTIDSIAFLDLDNRLINYLKDKAQNIDNNIISTTHQEIADELNSSREVISRLLKKLERKGIVNLHRNRIEFIDTM